MLYSVLIKLVKVVIASFEPSQPWPAKRCFFKDVGLWGLDIAPHIPPSLGMASTVMSWSSQPPGSDRSVPPERSCICFSTPGILEPPPAHQPLLVPVSCFWGLTGSRCRRGTGTWVTTPLCTCPTRAAAATAATSPAGAPPAAVRATGRPAGDGRRRGGSGCAPSIVPGT